MTHLFSPSQCLLKCLSIMRFKHINLHMKHTYLHEFLHNMIYKSTDSAMDPPITVNSLNYHALLKDSVVKKSLTQAKLIHLRMKKTAFKARTGILNNLLIIYSKYESPEVARRLFDEMPSKNVSSWTILIDAYCKNGFDSKAIEMFLQLRCCGCLPNEFTYATVIPAISRLGLSKYGFEVLAIGIRSGFQNDLFVARALLEMFGRIGRMDVACQLFDRMPTRGIFHWNAMVSGFARNGLTPLALELFESMPEKDIVSWNIVITMCAQKGFVDEAVSLFQDMPRGNVVSWNGIIAGFAQSGNCREAVQFYVRMRLAGVKPSRNVLASVLSACAKLRDLSHAMEIHADFVRNGAHVDVITENALMDMYAKCGCIDMAWGIFDKMETRNSASWNIMIAGYVKSGRFEEAVRLFTVMGSADVISWTTMIVGCFERGFLDMAVDLFEKMPERDVAAWTAMIEGYAQSGQGHKALLYYGQMKLSGLKPDSKVFIAALQVCAGMADLEQGRKLHEEIDESGFQDDFRVVNSLLDMYAKCSRVDLAHQLFDKIDHKDVVSWNTMIAGYAINGSGRKALMLFEQMQRCALSPNHATLLCVLEACCHSGLVEEGLSYFLCMTDKYCLAPLMDHYVCVINLLGHAGLLSKAKDIIDKMPLQPSAAVWRSFIGACAAHCNTELGEWAAAKIIKLASDEVPYVLLSNIYAASSRWVEVEKLRKAMRDRGIFKKPGFSWVEVNGEVHAFTAGQSG